MPGLRRITGKQTWPRPIMVARSKAKAMPIMVATSKSKAIAKAKAVTVAVVAEAVAAPGVRDVRMLQVLVRRVRTILTAPLKEHRYTPCRVGLSAALLARYCRTMLRSAVSYIKCG